VLQILPAAVCILKLKKSRSSQLCPANKGCVCFFSVGWGRFMTNAMKMYYAWQTQRLGHFNNGYCFNMLSWGKCARVEVSTKYDTCTLQDGRSRYRKQHMSWAVQSLEMPQWVVLQPVLLCYTAQSSVSTLALRSHYSLYILRACGLVVKSSWLHNGDVLCFLWGTNWIYICYVGESRPPLWSSGQECLATQRRCIVIYVK
jgi:hypothetical protein